MAPRTPNGACVCWASWGFASRRKWGCADRQDSCRATSFHIWCGDRLFIQHHGAQHPCPYSGGAGQPPGLLQHVGSAGCVVFPVSLEGVGMMGMVCRAQDHQSTWLVGETLSPGSWTGRLTSPRRTRLSLLQEPPFQSPWPGSSHGGGVLALTSRAGSGAYPGRARGGTPEENRGS